MILSISGIEFSYGSVKTVDGISFEAGPGDVVSILGPNGAGKSTLMKCMNAVLRPQSGTVMVSGTDILASEPREIAKLVGYVPQASPVTGNTVFDSILLGRKPHMGLDISERDIRLTSRIIDMMGLAHIQSKPVTEISGGEQQMVNISRALAQEPHVLLLDEPANNLDIKNQYEILHTLAHIVKSNCMCAVMINHDINLALRYSDRFVLMRDGRIRYAGGPEVVTPENIREIYGIDVTIGEINGRKVVVPNDLPQRFSHETQEFLSKRRKNPKQAEFFDERADRWDEISVHDGTKVAYISDLLGIGENDSILDVGTGTGVMIPYYLERTRNGHVTAVDYSANMIRVAQSKYPPSDRLEYRVADIYGLRDRGAFDLVVCYSCFPHFPDPVKAIGTLQQTLRSGGRLAIAHSSSKEHINRTHEEGGEEISKDYLPPAAVMQELFRANGLEVVFSRDDDEYYIIIGKLMHRRTRCPPLEQTHTPVTDFVADIR